MNHQDPPPTEPRSRYSSPNRNQAATNSYPQYFAFHSFEESQSAEGSWLRRWQTFRTRTRYYIPILRWLPRYNIRQDLFHDVVAGVTVAMLMIPQSLSYASGLAKLEPVFGLYSSFVPILIYGLLGTSRQISVGPEALISLLIGNAVKQITESEDVSHDAKATIVATLSFLVGIITLALGLARLGFVDSVMSRALLRGFITAVACVILVEQLHDLLGLQLPSGESLKSSAKDEDLESPFIKFLTVLEHIGSTNGVTAIMSVVSVTFLFGFAKLKKYLAVKYDYYGGIKEEVGEASSTTPLQAEDSTLPARRLSAASSVNSRTGLQAAAAAASSSPNPTGPAVAARNRHLLPPHIKIAFFIPEILLVVASSILFSYALGLNENYNVQILGEAALKSGFRTPALPRLKNGLISLLITPAVLISVLGFVESIVVVKKYGTKYNYTVSANRELVAFGTLNILGSITSCFPAFSSMARSQVNDAAGARTQLAGMITGIIILFTILFILPIFYWLPKCVMASIVLVAAAGLLEYEDVHFMWKIRAWKDLMMMLMTFFITIFWSVEAGVFISITLSLILVVKHSTYPKISILGRVVEGGDEQGGSVHFKIKYKPLEEILNTPGYKVLPEDQEILVVKIEESLFFANTGQMKDRLHRAEAYEGHLHVHPSEEERRHVGIKTKQPISSESLQYRRRRVDELRAARSKISPNIASGGSGNSDQTPPLEVSPEASASFQAAVTLEEQPVAAMMLEDRRFTSMDADRLSTSSVTELRGVIFDIGNMPSIDASAIQILTEIVQDYQRRDIEVCFVKLRDANKPMFLRCGLLGDIVGSDHYFRKIGDAMLFLHEKWNWHEQSAAVAEEAEEFGEAAETPGVGQSSFSTYSVL